MSEFMNPKYISLKEYTPGEQPKGKKFIKLNTNESPYPPSPEVIAAVSSEVVASLKLYPDPDCSGLRDALADFYHTGSENIFITNGSDDILNFAFMAFGHKGAVFPDITYGFYKVFCELHSVSYEEIPLKEDFSVFPQDYYNAGKMVVIANPNAPTGLDISLCEIEKIDTVGKSELLSGVEITAMCDIDNPLFGKSGAAYVFAPQKGADENQVAALDDGLRHAARIVKNDAGVDVSALSGAGAAGGMGAGMVAFFGAELRSGIETVLDTVNFEAKIDGADYVFTGEGKLDSQSLRGKVISGVAKRAKGKGVPVIAVVGGYEACLEDIYDMGVRAVFATNPMPVDFEKVRHSIEDNLAISVENILRIL